MFQPHTGDKSPAEEPLLWRGLIMSLVVSVIGVAVAFGVHLTEVQVSAILTLAGAILALVGAAAPFVVAAWARRAVDSPATVARKLADVTRRHR